MNRFNPLQNRQARVLILAAISVILLAACASGPRVRSDYAPDVDFSQYKSFGFFDPLSIESRNYSSLIGDHFRSAIRREMRARGYTESIEPDLLINVSASLNEKIKVTETASPSPYYGYRHGYYAPWGGYGMAHETHVRQYTEGTVNIDLVDRYQKRLVWEGVGIGTVTDKKRRNLRETVSNGVAKVFAEYPFRAGQ